MILIVFVYNLYLISYILKESFALVRKRSRVQASSTAQNRKSQDFLFLIYNPL